MIGSGTQKLEWNELPPEIRAEVETYFGSPVVEAKTQPGGFSPGVAAKILTGGGDAAFVKCASSLVSQFSADANRREIKHASALQGNPRIPRLLHSFESEGWVTLIYEVVEGKHPALPWKIDELDFVFSELVQLSASLTPCPHSEQFQTLEEGSDATFSGWRNFTNAGSAIEELEDPWVEKHLGVLTDLEADWTRAARGTSLVHTDLRADQILIAKDRAFFLDWPHAKIGAPWIDFLFMAPSIVLQGGPGMNSLIHRSPLANVRKSDLLSVAAALAGFFLWNSLQPPPPRLVTLRAFQRSQGNVMTEWLKDGQQGLE
jgi:Phosphotransferase enzyme family